MYEFGFHYGYHFARQSKVWDFNVMYMASTGTFLQRNQKRRDFKVSLDNLRVLYTCVQLLPHGHSVSSFIGRIRFISYDCTQAYWVPRDLDDASSSDAVRCFLFIFIFLIIAAVKVRLKNIKNKDGETWFVRASCQWDPQLLLFLLSRFPMISGQRRFLKSLAAGGRGCVGPLRLRLFCEKIGGKFW